MPSCAAFGCNVRRKDKTVFPPISLHVFPFEEKLRKKWVLAIRRRLWKPSRQSRLCSKHFTEDCFDRSKYYSKLKKGAIPTIFECYPRPLEVLQVEYDEDTVDNQFNMEDHHPSTSNFRPKKEVSPPPPRWEEYRPPREHKPPKRKITEDPWIDEAYKILKSSISHDKDDCAVFGEYIATKLRRYSPYTKSTVEHLISNILFNAEIGKYDDLRKQRSTSVSANGTIDCTDDS